MAKIKGEFMKKYKIEDFRGVIPAVMTVFDQNENIDENGMRQLIRFLLKQKVHGLYLTGSTGEGFLMNETERMKVVEIVIDEVKGRVPVMVHVGAISTKISILLAKHAAKVGADAISSVPPFYFKFSDDQVFNYYKDISESTNLPFIVYNVPLAGLMGLNLITRLATIKNVKGIKYTAQTHYEITQLKELLGKGFLIYSGSDEMALSGILAGSDGIIGSFYNVIPDLFIKLWNAINQNKMELAKNLQIQAVNIIMFTLKYGSMTAVMKLLLRNRGINAGYARRPFNNFSKEKETAILKDYQVFVKKNKLNSLEIFKNGKR
jgi:N-acetylneuraminate lyase